MARLLVTGGSGFIGTHLVERLRTTHDIINVDRAPPKLAEHRSHWQALDIKDGEALRALLLRERPQWLIHLAARTDLDGRTLEDYSDNIAGTRNVVEAAMAAGVERAVITSTQFVVRPGIVPPSPTHFEPYSVYGESKVGTETVTRELDPPFTWTIVRPTIIWGPWHPTMPQGIWRFIAKRWFLHPGKEPVYRAYAYVGNVVGQIERILAVEPRLVHRETLYVGERVMSSLDWANAFSLRLTGKPVHVVPRWAWRSLAGAGDLAGRLGIGFPMNSARYGRMVVNDVVPIEATYEKLGEPAWRFETAVDSTVAWLREQGLAPREVRHG
jgi:nucleoside-diphosphate-sugar epimerase